MLNVCVLCAGVAVPELLLVVKLVLAVIADIGRRIVNMSDSDVFANAPGGPYHYYYLPLSITIANAKSMWSHRIHDSPLDRAYVLNEIKISKIFENPVWRGVPKSNGNGLK